MTSDHSRNIMNAYFTAMSEGRFSQHFTDAIIGLHERMPPHETTRLIFGDGAAFLEGRCLSQQGLPEGPAYCVSYDLQDSKIAAMRAYGALGEYRPAVD